MNNRTSMRDNMQDKQITIESIYKGQANSYISGGDYLSSIAIDPDANVSTAIQKISGTVTPIAHETTEAIDGNPMWILPNSKNDEHLIYTDTGKVYFLDSSLEIIGSPITLTNASGNGAVYYNNYYYLIKDNDLDRIKVDDKTQEVDLLSNHVTTTNVLITSNKQSTAQNLTFGDGQDYSRIAQYIPFDDLANPEFNRLRLQMSCSTGTHQVRVRIRTGGSTTEPDGTIQGTDVVTVTEAEEVFTLEYGNIASFGDDVWLEIDGNSLSFSSGQFINVSATTQTSLPDGNAYGYDGTNWEVASPSNMKFQLYFEEKNTSNLNNISYPINGVTTIPNHSSYVAGNDKLYVSDVTSDDVGTIHGFRSFGIIKIYQTTTATIGTDSIINGSTSNASATVIDILKQPFTGSDKGTEGVMELLVFTPRGSFIEDEVIRVGGSAIGLFESFEQGKSFYQLDFNEVRLPIDYYPTALSQIGTDIAILGIKSKDSLINQGNASMFLWDTFDSTFYREIELPFPNATALLTHNGFPFLWGGDDRGYSFSYYRGGDQIDEIFYVDDGHSPFAGAVLGENNRVLWGTNTTYPETSGSIMAYGSRNGGIEKGVHNVARVDDQVTSFTLPNKTDSTILIGSGDTLSKNGGNATSVFRTNVYSVAEDFNVKEISFTLVEGVTADTNITVTTYLDNETNSKVINTIDSTNYEVGTKKITDYPDIQGDTNFFVEFKWNGDAVPIQLPIKIIITEIA